MHKIEGFIDGLFEKHNNKFVYVVGYDEPGTNFVDIQTYGSENIPDFGTLELMTSFYKPMEIRGNARDMIWAECYDKIGKLDLPKTVDSGEVVYYLKFKD